MDRKLKTALVIGGIALVILVILPLIIGLTTGWQGCVYGTEEYHMMGPWMMGGFGLGWLMPVFWIAALGLLIWALVALTKGGSDARSQDSAKPKSALEILKDRYASGEIDKAEFEEKRKDLA